MTKKTFDPTAFTLYELSRQTRLTYHKCRRVLNFLMQQGLIERVEHNGDNRRRRYRFV